MRSTRSKTNDSQFMTQREVGRRLGLQWADARELVKQAGAQVVDLSERRWLLARCQWPRVAKVLGLEAGAA